MRNNRQSLSELNLHKYSIDMSENMQGNTVQECFSPLNRSGSGWAVLFWIQGISIMTRICGPNRVLPQFRFNHVRRINNTPVTRNEDVIFRDKHIMLSFHQLRSPKIGTTHWDRVEFEFSIRSLLIFFLFISVAKSQLYLVDVPRPLNEIMLCKTKMSGCVFLSSETLDHFRILSWRKAHNKTNERNKVEWSESARMCWLLHGIRYGVSPVLSSIEIQMGYRRAMNKIRSGKKHTNSASNERAINKIFKPHVNRMLVRKWVWFKVKM